ncbi:hypothetical protein D3C84_912270 [compost metagenome]
MEGDFLYIYPLFDERGQCDCFTVTGVVVSGEEFAVVPDYQIVGHNSSRIKCSDDFVLHTQQARLGSEVAIQIEWPSAEVLCVLYEYAIQCPCPPHDFLFGVTDCG